MMDDVAYKLKMDPVEFVLKNMTRKSNDADALHELHARRVHPPRRGGVRMEEALASAARLGSPVRSNAAPACRSWRSASALGPQQRGDPPRLEGHDTPCYVGVTDVGAGAKTTMAHDRGGGAGRAAVAESMSSGATPIAARTRWANPAAAPRS